MSPLGLVHFVFSLAAILTGAIVVLLPKGTRWHRTWGHAYVTSMVGTAVTALSIYDMTGGFGPFHFAALVATATLGGGLYTVLARRPRGSWMEAHATWMSWSYIGLLAAAVSETLTRFIMPAAQGVLEARSLWPLFWTTVGVGTLVVVGVGWWLVKTRLPEALARTPEAIRRERQHHRSVDTGRPPDAKS